MRVNVGDKLLGIQSSGLHSNGFSLVRKVFKEEEIKKGLWRELLKPTLIYAKPVLGLIKKIDVKGIAHITGGAFYDKLPRILHGKKSIIIYKDAWEPPGIFKEIKKRAGISEREMFRTFNMGIGMILIVSEADVKAVLKAFDRAGEPGTVIGSVVKGDKTVSVL